MIAYLNTRDESVKTSHAELIEEIARQNLLYPVTAVDGTAVYDGAVSYPAVVRAVSAILGEGETQAR